MAFILNFDPVVEQATDKQENERAKLRDYHPGRSATLATYPTYFPYYLYLSSNSTNLILIPRANKDSNEDEDGNASRGGGRQVDLKLPNSMLKL